MRSKIVGPLGACVLVCLLCGGCAMETVVRTPPPPDRTEVIAAAPSDQHFWVRGHWQWNGNDYAWAPGHWEARRADASWKAGHWRNISGGWVWIEGRWAER
jgi:hypothetical protein